MGISRREFLKGAAAGALGVAVTGMLSGCNDASQSQPGSQDTFADSIAWDDTYDVIVAGFGIGGGSQSTVSGKSTGKRRWRMFQICRSARIEYGERRRIL